MDGKFQTKALETVGLMFEGESIVGQPVGAVELVQPEPTEDGFEQNPYVLVYLETQVLRFTVSFEQALPRD